MTHPLVAAVRAGLHEAADPVRAPQMQAYMKSAMPYLGIQTAPREAACREVFARYALADAETWRDTVLSLWRTARFREERYAAISLSGARAYAAKEAPHPAAADAA